MYIYRLTFFEEIAVSQALKILFFPSALRYKWIQVLIIEQISYFDYQII